MNTLIFAAIFACFPDQEIILFTEEVRTKKYVTAVIVENNSQIAVPVVNGYIPVITFKKQVDGSSCRILDYKDKIKYKEEPIIYYENVPKNVLPKKIKLPKPVMKKPSEFDNP
jgi:hypothetical protein